MGVYFPSIYNHTNLNFYKEKILKKDIKLDLSKMEMIIPWILLDGSIPTKFSKLYFTWQKKIE